MKVAVNGEVAIPLPIWEKLGITPYSEVDFIEDSEQVYIVRKSGQTKPGERFYKFRGAATSR